MAEILRDVLEQNITNGLGYKSLHHDKMDRHEQRTNPTHLETDSYLQFHLGVMDLKTGQIPGTYSNHESVFTLGYVVAGLFSSELISPADLGNITQQEVELNRQLWLADDVYPVLVAYKNNYSQCQLKLEAQTRQRIYNILAGLGFEFGL